MRPFDIIDLEQGSAQWRAWRRTGIGASDAPAIMGENRRKSADDLRLERRNPDMRGAVNRAMARGNRLEPQARDAYCARKGFAVTPICLQSRSHPWMLCSLDGAAIDQGVIVEIKCGEATYRACRKNRSIPIPYRAQVQHILAVSGFEALDFWCYSPADPPILVTAQRDEAYICSLVRREKEFWESVSGNL